MKFARTTIVGLALMGVFGAAVGSFATRYWIKRTSTSTGPIQLTQLESDARTQRHPSRLQAPLSLNEYGARCASALHAEAPDEGWAKGAGQLIKKRLAPVLTKTNSELSSIECRRSMCRIESKHGSLKDRDAYLKKGLADPSTKIWNGDVFVPPAEKGHELMSVAFIAREGYQLPR